MHAALCVHHFLSKLLPEEGLVSARQRLDWQSTPWPQVGEDRAVPWTCLQSVGLTVGFLSPVTALPLAVETDRNYGEVKEQTP